MAENEAPARPASAGPDVYGAILNQVRSLPAPATTAERAAMRQITQELVKRKALRAIGNLPVAAVHAVPFPTTPVTAPPVLSGGQTGLRGAKVMKKILGKGKLGRTLDSVTKERGTEKVAPKRAKVRKWTEEQMSQTIIWMIRQLQSCAAAQKKWGIPQMVRLHPSRLQPPPRRPRADSPPAPTVTTLPPLSARAPCCRQSETTLSASSSSGQSCRT